MAQREGGSGNRTAGRKTASGKGKGQRVNAKALTAAAKAAAAGVKKGAEEVRLSNYRPPSLKDETAFVTWAEKIRRQDKVVQKMMEDVRTERGSYAELFAAAAEAGIPKDRLRVLRKTIAEEKRDPGERMAEAREMAFQAKALKSPMVQLGLFDGIDKPPSMEEWALAGKADGLKGITSNPPGKPGSDEHTHYLAGHKEGQAELAKNTFGEKKPPAPPAGGGGFPPAGEPQGKLRVISP